MPPEDSGLRVFFFTLVAVILVIPGLGLTLWGPDLKKEIFLCWLAGGINAYSFTFITRKGIGKRIDRFLGRFALGHVIRVGAVLVPVYLAFVDDGVDFVAATSMVLAGYFLILVVELWELAGRAE